MCKFDTPKETKAPAASWRAAPNVLTLGRIAVIPLLVGCFYIPFGDGARWAAFSLFVLASVTDYLDGYLARLWKQQSAFGRMLDPIADKLLVAACLLVLVGDKTIDAWSVWAALIILSREILVSGLREFLGDVDVTVPVTWLAKWKTAFQFLALGFLLVGEAGEAVLPGTVWIGTVLLWVAAVLTLYTGCGYLRAALAHVQKQTR